MSCSRMNQRSRDGKRPLAALGGHLLGKLFARLPESLRVALCSEGRPEPEKSPSAETGPAKDEGATRFLQMLEKEHEQCFFRYWLKSAPRWLQVLRGARVLRARNGQLYLENSERPGQMLGAGAYHRQQFLQTATASLLKGRHVALCAPPEGEAASEMKIEAQRRVAAVSWLSIAEEVAQRRNVDLVFLDGTCNATRSRDLAVLARSTGRVFRSSLVDHFDIWRGDWRSIFDRLVTLVGPDLASHLYTLEKTVLMLACRYPSGPPRSSTELIKRLTYEELREHDLLAETGSALPAAIEQLRSRCQEIFGDYGVNLDGEWAWEDGEVSYIGLLSPDPKHRQKVGSVLANGLVDHLHKQGPGRSCVIFFDALSEDAREIHMGPLLEIARCFGAGVVLLPEVLPARGHHARTAVPGQTLTEELLA